MKLYVEAKSKADLIRRLAAGEEISGFNYSMFGGGGHYMLDDNLEDGTIIAVYTKKVQGNPVAKAWGTWTNKVLKAESFNTEARPTGDGVLFSPSDNHVCDFCNIRTPFARIMDENPDSDGSYEDEWGGSYKFICPICAELMSQSQAESFEAMSLDENDTIICDQCNKNVEGDSIYADFTLKCDCGNILYEDNSYGPFDIADYYGAEGFAAEAGPNGRFYGGSRIEERKSIWQTAGVMGLTIIAAGAAYIWSHKKE